jgi:hypothetical protein
MRRRREGLLVGPASVPAGGDAGPTDHFSLIHDRAVAYEPAAEAPAGGFSSAGSLP